MKFFALCFLGLLSTISIADSNNEVVLRSLSFKNLSEKDLPLIEEASDVFVRSFSAAYNDYSLEYLGWPDNGKGEESSKKEIFSSIVPSDFEMLKIGSEKEYTIILAIIKNSVVGFLSLEKSNPRTLYFRQLAVDPIHQKKGIASKMLNYAVELFPNVKRFYAATRIFNTTSILFWKSAGYKICDIREVNEVVGTSYSIEKYVGLKRFH